MPLINISQLKPMCMGTLSIKIMINSEIFLTHKSECRFSQQDGTQKSNLNGEETKFYKLNHKCFSSTNLVYILISKKFQCLRNLFFVQYISNHFAL